jgi:hypothetical protein
MANRYAVANGNWSNTAIWDGGTLPGAADIVRPNGFAVTIDQNITVTALRNDASAPAVAGGTFTLTGNYTLNVSSDIQCFATSLLTYNGTGTAYITKVNSTSAIISSTTTNTTNTVTHSGTGTLVVDMVMNSIAASEVTRNNIAVTGGGTLTCLQEVSAVSGNQGSGAGTQIIQVLTTAGATLNLKTLRGGTNSTYGVVTNVRTNINVVGNLYSGGTNGGYALWNTDNASVITIVGDVYGTTNGNAGSAVCLLNSTTAPITMTGNVIAANSGNTISTNGSLLITGNVTGGTGAASVTIGFSVGSNTQIIGTITGGGSNGMPGIAVTGGIFNHIGTAQASAYGSAIYCIFPTTSTITCTGPFLRNGYIPAIASQTLRINAAYNPYFEFKKSDGTNVTYVDQSTSNFPAIGDVRNGTSYASGVYTGTLKVPTAAQVLAGIPVDATTGTLLMTPQQFWNYLISSGFVSGSMGERLQNASTVATTGAQVASYNI